MISIISTGQFNWVDGSAVGFTNFRPNQPNNGNNNQHCTLLRPDGLWDDIICNRAEQFVCQKAARP